jgi:exopolyphosphatase/guanosine-5'-triphosphate,3'-diphosphate pyrophosphatase
VPVARPVFGAVDVGSTSVHLLVATVAGHRLDPLVDESVLIGLGDTVEEHGAIPGPQRAELVGELARYAARARELGAREIAFVGTQPLRRAADARAVVAAVEAATGVPLHVLDHDEEGLLNLLGATAGRPVERPLAVVDVGGGSTEIVIVEPGARARAGAIPAGCATLVRRLVAHDPPLLQEVEALRAEAHRLAAGALPGGPAAMLALGGTSSNLAKIVPAAGRDRQLTPRRLAAACLALRAEPAADVAARFGITAKRARLLPAGAAILGALMARYGVARATAVEEGLREGVVLALARAGRDWRDRLDALAHGWTG